MSALPPRAAIQGISPYCREWDGPAVLQLKPAQIAAALTKALASGRRKDGGSLSPRTVHHVRAILKSALAQAVKWETSDPQSGRCHRRAQDRAFAYGDLRYAPDGR